MVPCVVISAGPVAAQTPIRVTMAWPENVTVEARTTTTVVQRNGASADSSSSASNNQFRVRSHAEGLLVEMDEAPPSEPLLMKDAQVTMQYVAAEAARRLIVTRAGRFLRLEDTATLARRMRERMTSRVPPEVAASPPFQAQVRQLSIERTIRRTEREWNELIGHLVDREWIEGRTETDTIVMSDAAVPGMAISQLRQQTFRGVADCPAGSGATACWRFDIHEEIDTTALRRYVRNNAQAMGLNEGQAMSMPLPNNSSVTTHIVDAATARPLRQESSSGLVTPMDGGDHTFLSRRVTTYAWRPM